MKVLKLFFVLGITSVLASCVHEDEHPNAAVNLDGILRNQCQQTLYYAINSRDYVTCYNKHKEWLAHYGIETPLSYSKVTYAQGIIENVNRSCYTHWGTKNISPEQLRECVKSRIKSNSVSLKRDEISDHENEDLQKALIYEGDRKNRAALHLKILENERQKMAKRTGKDPNDITCRMIKTMSGTRKVICK